MFYTIYRTSSSPDEPEEVDLYEISYTMDDLWERLYKKNVQAFGFELRSGIRPNLDRYTAKQTKVLDDNVQDLHCIYSRI